MLSEEELESLRQAIDSVDEQILGLVAQRARLVLQVGDYKRERGQKVYDPERERALLERISNNPPWPLTAASVRRVFERLVDESRSLEQAHVASPKTRFPT